MKKTNLPEGKNLLQYWDQSTETDDSEVKIVAYYLPQFHPIAENDEWWGPGFTEWTNVTAAKPLFRGHYQPRLPADLGFYDLRLDQVQQEQVKLAKRFGIQGFCYYFYWFSGKTLMTLPIDRHLEQNLEMDFCLCWANENWTRRWDGADNEVLMNQSHNYETDATFIQACLPYFRSNRYIKINGAPLLQVYRISLLERPRETIEHWRQIVRAEGFPDLHVSMVESFGQTDPFEFGCDSSSQFPPHGLEGDSSNFQLEELDPKFSGNIYSYSEIVRNEISRPNPPHMRFRAAMPSWDNTARKGVAGNIFAGATPELFETWLSYLVGDARRRLPEGQRFVFINAWNEWAEGAHLEPDRRNGQANLRAVRDALAPKSRALSSLIQTSANENDGLDETRRYVAGLINANRELTRLIRREKFDLRVGEENRFVEVSESLLRIKSVTDVTFNIDYFNGREIQMQKGIPLSAPSGVSLRGWAVHRGRISKIMMVRLRPTIPKRGVSSYVASVNYHEKRVDVVEALGLDLNLVDCGFNFSASLTGLTPGVYELELVFPDNSDPNLGHAIQSDLFILIG